MDRFNVAVMVKNNDERLNHKEISLLAAMVSEDVMTSFAMMHETYYAMVFVGFNKAEKIGLDIQDDNDELRKYLDNLITTVSHASNTYTYKTVINGEEITVYLDK